MEVPTIRVGVRAAGEQLYYQYLLLGRWIKKAVRKIVWRIRYRQPAAGF
jgi:hypothetical protein